MADLFLPIRTLVVEWRYAATLAIYSKMDVVGLAFAEEYSDWQRSPLALEIWSKKHRRRFCMAHKRSFFHVVDQGAKFGLDVVAETERAGKLFERLGGEIEASTIERVGFRQWVAFPRTESFRELVARAKRKFQPQCSTLEDCLGGSVDDVAYVVDVATSDGWKYDLRAGPMEKKQWFEIVPHERNLFGSQSSFDAYREAFPGQFFFVDIDCHHENISRSDAIGWLTIAKRLSHDVFTRIHKYFSE